MRQYLEKSSLSKNSKSEVIFHPSSTQYSVDYSQNIVLYNDFDKSTNFIINATPMRQLFQKIVSKQNV